MSGEQRMVMACYFERDFDKIDFFKNKHVAYEEVGKKLV